MTGPVFVDSNVLIYARDTGHADKQSQASAGMIELWRTRNGRVSIQVLTEYYVAVTRKIRPGLDEETARQDVRSLFAWKPLRLGERILEEAWRVQDRYRLSFWDALILGAAQTGACRYLLTEDLQDKQRFGDVTIVNPFSSTPGSLS